MKCIYKSIRKDKMSIQVSENKHIEIVKEHNRINCYVYIGKNPIKGISTISSALGGSETKEYTLPT